MPAEALHRPQHYRTIAWPGRDPNFDGPLALKQTLANQLARAALARGGPTPRSVQVSRAESNFIAPINSRRFAVEPSSALCPTEA